MVLRKQYKEKTVEVTFYIGNLILLRMKIQINYGKILNFYGPDTCKHLLGQQYEGLKNLLSDLFYDLLN